MDEVRWTATGGGQGRAIRRPDGSWWIRLPEDVSTWRGLLDAAATHLGGTMLVERPGSDSPLCVAELRRAGFAPDRSETVWRLPVADLLTLPRVETVHRIVSVSTLDPDPVAALDNEIRRDIPGCEQWQGTGAQLLASLDDPEFDPDLYLVAQHPTTGSLDGLIRVWTRSPYPRLGCLGVTRPWRRTRLAPTLARHVADVLHARGVSHIITETDPTNRESHPMARRHGGEVIHSSVEWRR